MKKISEIWNAIPAWARVAVWIGTSAVITSVGSYLLGRPELFAFYGVINFIMYVVNDLDKKYRREK